MRSKRRKKADYSPLVMMGVCVLLVIAFICSLFYGCTAGKEKPPVISADVVDMVDASSPTVTPVETTVSEPPVATTTPEPSFDEVYYPYGDPDNYIYPFNTMSADWGAEVYEEGFKYYRLPSDYQLTGGCLPEVVQVYLWSLCKQKELDYYIMLALIERESSYHWDAFREGDNSIGYFQIIERWHEDRIEAESADVYNPYGNIRVGLNFMGELYERYGDWNKALMAYNMGEYWASRYWEDGEYGNTYSRSIIERAQEIKEIIQG